MSTGSHGNNEVEVVVLGVTADPVLASLEEKHILAHCFQVLSLCVWSSYFLCDGRTPHQPSYCLGLRDVLVLW